MTKVLEILEARITEFMNEKWRRNKLGLTSEWWDGNINGRIDAYRDAITIIKDCVQDG